MKKFKLKLTASLVSLFISLVLLAFSDTNRYCLFFGLIMLAIAVLFFAFHKRDDVAKKSTELNSAYEEGEIDEEVFNSEQKFIKKERRKLTVSFTSFACLLIIVAFVALFG